MLTANAEKRIGSFVVGASAVAGVVPDVAAGC